MGNKNWNRCIFTIYANEGEVASFARPSRITNPH